MQEGKRGSKEGKESNVFTQTRCGTGAPRQHQHKSSRRAALRSAETDSSVRAPAQAQLPLTVSCLCFCRNNDTHWGPRRTPSLTHDRIVRPRSFSVHPSENDAESGGSREPGRGAAPAQAGGADVWGMGLSHRPALGCLLH